MADCDEAAAFAIKLKNPMSLVKARELKSKLAGLLIERVEQVTIDLTGALEAARQHALHLDSQQDPILIPAAGVNGATIEQREPNKFRDQEPFRD